MKIIITGGNGMLGKALEKILKEKELEIFALSREELDICNEKSILENIEKINPDLIINSAAYTNVEKAEEEKDLAIEINSKAPANLARICKEKNIKFFHISTDYVFGDNKIDGHIETDPIENPALNIYGESKRLGEIEVQEANPESYIIRVQWTFGEGGKNIVDTMLNLAETKTELNIVDDETGVPSYTIDVARQIEYLIFNI